MRLTASQVGLLMALLLPGCAADNQSRLPAFMRVKEAEPAPPEAPPDVALLVRKNLDMIFVVTTQPRALEATSAKRTDRGDAWTACVRARIVSIAGAPLPKQTYRLTIRQNEIIDRRRAGPSDSCDPEIFKPIMPTK
ncbi:conserved exported hypothetical protein [Bradyrhizobium sp. ORS 375]|uniref:hypothetical protein n=1 Tax=Bradyrhizobium sp. (strain ORS 375) TaxID=566679 RepID=UPI000240A71F|nr:hypothetical protein [Bradyrhizobium sp. ORS 375]CCD92285.1 conserved exported hypothetical protein [Bradyrhizobium sp. ORS 375]